MDGYPNVFAYDNYRDFLKDLCNYLKARDKKFSLRYFARVAGFKSHNFLRMVIIGKGNLSNESIEKFTRAFKFKKEEAKFFKNLVLFNQASSHEEKKIFANELLRSRDYRKIHPLSESQYRFFDQWYFTAVRELTALSEFREDPEWIASHIIPPITPAQAKLAIEELLKLDLIKRDENMRLVRNEPLTGTPDEVISTYVSSWHKEYLKIAAQSIDTVKKEERDITAVYLVFSKENLHVLKDKIRRFREEILELEAKQDDPNAIYQMNFQLFPIAAVGREES